ncbi:GLPGLI family protein [Flavobacterium zhairuonense]|uniref:GLPGLI family protein n=1 Tax=Flavobacterium zhairuonense TaxID=2493631 RepID=UPI001042B991|nr:GLPGLI family protein [Flavobacterium zhairuonense]KAF2507780.1 GLPGLI family protein [Flavobacterium zhairuonense]
MTNRVIIILIFFTVFISSAQIRNGRIEYGVNIEMLEGLKENGPLKNTYAETVENAKYLSFVLNFDKEKAVFSFDEGLAVANSDLFMAKISAGYMNVVYQNKEYSLCAVNGFGNYLLKTDAISEWILENDTKEIQGFLCYKATSTKKINNGKGSFVFPIIAWYCPKIPVSFGPNGYGNLPGLILELQVRNVVYGVKKIDLNLAKPPIMDNPKEYPVINQQEFDEMVMTAFKNRNAVNGFKKPDDKF